MKQAVVFLVVAVAVMASAKPYEPYRKPSTSNQYPVYFSDEFLSRLFGERSKDSSVDAPFVRLPSDRLSNAEKNLLELLDLQAKPQEDISSKQAEQTEIDAENRQPLMEEKYPDAADVLKEVPVGAEETANNDSEKEKQQKSDQQPKEDDKDKEEKQQKPDKQPKEDDKEEKQEKSDKQPKEGDKDKQEKQQKPDQQPKKGNKDKEEKQQKPESEKRQDGKIGKPNSNEINKDRSEKHRKPGMPMTSERNKENRPDGERPSNDLAPRSGKDRPRGDRDKPEVPPRRQPESPLVQINVNVASPVL